jgi:hypothetical protein
VAKDTFFNKWWCDNWVSTCRRHPNLPTCIKTHSKWMKDFNVRPETLKLPKENIGKIPEDKGIGKDFLNTTPIYQEIIARVDKWVSSKSKKLMDRK